MGILTCGLVLYLLSFVLQVALFRTRLPKNQILTILILYPTVLLFFLVARFSGLFESTPLFNLSLVESIYLSAVFMAVLPNYVVLYGLIEAESPSSLMVLLLEASAEKGLARTAFNDLLTNDLFLWHRVTALEKGGYVLRKGDRYFITPKGIIYMRFWLVPRYLMGRTTYGG